MIIGVWVEDNLNYIFSTLDNISELYIYHNIDDLMEGIQNKSHNFIISSSHFVNLQIINNIRDITNDRTKVITICDNDNIQSAYGYDFLVKPININFLSHKMKLHYLNNPDKPISLHTVDSIIINDICDKLNMIENNLNLQLPKSYTMNFIKNINWNLQLLNILHGNITININIMNHYFNITKSLMDLFQTNIQFNLLDNINTYNQNELNGLLILLLCISRYYTNTLSLKINIQNRIINVNQDFIFNNTFISNILKILFTNIPYFQIQFQNIII